MRCPSRIWIDGKPFDVHAWRRMANDARKVAHRKARDLGKITPYSLGGFLAISPADLTPNFRVPADNPSMQEAMR